MKRGKQIDAWYPLWIDKWLLGSTRFELILRNQDGSFQTDLRGIFLDLLTLSKKDDGYIRANPTTPYLLPQLAGMLMVPEDLLRLTIELCLKFGKLEERELGIYYITTTKDYELSRSRRYEFTQQMEAKAEPPKKDDRTKPSGHRIESSTDRKNIPPFTLFFSSLKNSDIPIEDKIPMIIELWNKFADGHDLATILGIAEGSAREKAVLARLKDPAWDLEKILKAIHAQPFTHGDNKEGWAVDFDFILKPSRYIKLLEGAYKNRICGRAKDRQPDDPHVGSGKK